MKKWFGSAAICINENKDILMVKSVGSEDWAVPSGGIEEGESPEECCIREVKEETGYDVEIVEKLFIKEVKLKEYKVKTYYFLVNYFGESGGINDPDELIIEVDWKSLSEIQSIKHGYPEDLAFLMDLMK